MSIFNSPWRLFIFLNVIHFIIFIVTIPIFAGYSLLYLLFGFIPTVLTIGFFTFLYYLYLVSVGRIGKADQLGASSGQVSQTVLSEIQNTSSTGGYAEASQGNQSLQAESQNSRTWNYPLAILLYGPLFTISLMKHLNVPLGGYEYFFAVLFICVYLVVTFCYFFYCKYYGKQFKSGFIPIFKIPLLDFILFIGLLYLLLMTLLMP